MGIRSRPTTDDYRLGWDRVFSREISEAEDADDLAIVRSRHREGTVLWESVKDRLGLNDPDQPVEYE
jgi:hypothetical protein